MVPTIAILGFTHNGLFQSYIYISFELCEVTRDSDSRTKPTFWAAILLTLDPLILGDCDLSFLTLFTLIEVFQIILMLC